MKIICAVLSVLLLLSLGYIFHLNQSPVNKIVLLDVERIIAESTPGKAGREHLNIIDRRFQQAMDELHARYTNAPAEEQQRVYSNAEETLVRQFSVEERNVGDSLKKIIHEEAEKWSQQNNIGAIFPAQLALLNTDKQLDCTDEILAAVNKREIVFAEFPQLKINQPSSTTSSVEKEDMTQQTAEAKVRQ